MTALVNGAPVAAVTYGTPLTLSATVAAQSGSAAPSLGSVDFLDVTTNLDLGVVSTETVTGTNAVFQLIASATKLQVIQASGGVHTISATYSPGTGFNGSSGTLNGELTVNPAPLTITAVANTKTYDSTTTAAAVPTVSGLVAGDTVSGLAEAYANGNATITPQPVILSGLAIQGFTVYRPMALAIDGTGNIYVIGLASGLISEYAPGATTPTAHFQGDSGAYNFSLTFDKSGNLYAACYFANTVDEFLPGGGKVVFTGLNGPWGLAFDSAGNLYVANSGANTVSVFAAGATTPTNTLTGLNYPEDLAFDAAGNLFVTNANANTVSEFAPGATTPSRTLNGLLGPRPLTFDSSGNLFVGNFGSSFISEFVAGGNYAHCHAPVA